MAARLSEDGQHSVIVLEYGGTDAGPLIQMPGALSYPMNMPIYDWGYRSEPEPHLGGRQLACPRGKVIGGSSSINGMVYVRGHAGDYDHWAESGAEGWSYADVLPYFLRMENCMRAARAAIPIGAARAGRCISAAGNAIFRCIKLLWRQATRRGSKSPKTITVRSRKGFRRWSKPSGAGGAGLRPMPISNQL